MVPLYLFILLFLLCGLGLSSGHEFMFKYNITSIVYLLFIYLNACEGSRIMQYMDNTVYVDKKQNNIN